MSNPRHQPNRRSFFKNGSKPISKSKNPGLLKMAQTPKGREAVKKMKFNPDRIVAKTGGRAKFGSGSPKTITGMKPTLGLKKTEEYKKKLKQKNKGKK